MLAVQPDKEQFAKVCVIAVAVEGRFACCTGSAAELRCGCFHPHIHPAPSPNRDPNNATNKQTVAPEELQKRREANEAIRRLAMGGIGGGGGGGGAGR